MASVHDIASHYLEADMVSSTYFNASHSSTRGRRMVRFEAMRPRGKRLCTGKLLALYSVLWLLTYAQRFVMSFKIIANGISYTCTSGIDSDPLVFDQFALLWSSSSSSITTSSGSRASSSFHHYPEVPIYYLQITIHPILFLD